MKTVVMNVTRPISPTESHAAGATVTIADDLAEYYIGTGAARYATLQQTDARLTRAETDGAVNSVVAPGGELAGVNRSTDASGNTVLLKSDGNFFGGVFAKSGVAASVTGTTNETVLGTIVIPANTLGINGQVEIEVAWSVTASANNKVVKAKWNGSNIHANTLTNSNKVQTHNRVCNRGSKASQFSAKLYSVYGYGADTNDTTFTVDTETTDITITFTGTLTNTDETITMESYLIKVWP